MTKIPKQPLSFPRPVPLWVSGVLFLRRFGARWCRYSALGYDGQYTHKQRSGIPRL